MTAVRWVPRFGDKTLSRSQAVLLLALLLVSLGLWWLLGWLVATAIRHLWGS